MADPFLIARSSVAAVLELAALDKSNWDLALQKILRIDSHALDVDRTSYWKLCEHPRSIRCELGYVRSLDALEQGAVLLAAEAPSYLDELNKAKIIPIEDVFTDPRSRELHA